MTTVIQPLRNARETAGMLATTLAACELPAPVEEEC
jgi:hypothetical protein